MTGTAFPAALASIVAISLQSTSYHQRQIVFLVAQPEFSGRVLHVLQYVRSLEVLVLPECVQKTRFAEFFSTLTSCLCDPIGIETQDVSGLQPNFGHGTVPVQEQAEYRGGRVKSLDRTSPAQQYGRVVPAVDIMQSSRGIAIPPKKQSSIAVFRRVLVEVAIYRDEQLGNIFRGSAVSVSYTHLDVYKRQP